MYNLVKRLDLNNNQEYTWGNIYLKSTGLRSFRCLPNIRVADRNYLHTVIAVDNTQVMGKVLDVFKQKTGNTFSVYRRPKEFGQRGKHNYDNTNK